MNLWRMKKILKGSDIMKNGKKWSGGYCYLNAMLPSSLSVVSYLSSLPDKL